MSDEKKSESSGKTIFIIEDDTFLIKAYEIKFAKEGMKVRIATDGTEALGVIKSDPPADVVLLDLMLPGISGFDVLTEMRKNPKWKKVPVIILTNLGQSQDIERGKSLGAEDYIIKANVRINDVVKKVKAFL